LLFLGLEEWHSYVGEGWGQRSREGNGEGLGHKCARGISPGACVYLAGV
jgi:hypothetical protein